MQIDQTVHATWEHGDGQCCLIRLRFSGTMHQTMTLIWTGWHNIADTILIDPRAGAPLDEARRARLAPYLANAPKAAHDAIARFV